MLRPRGAGSPAEERRHEACSRAYGPSASTSSACVPRWTTRPGVDDQHLVGALGGGQPVRDGERRPAVGERVQRAGQPPLGGRVDGAGRLVEHQQVGVGDVGAGDGDQLPLPRRQRLAALPDRRRRRPSARPSTQVAEAELLEGGGDLARRSCPAGRSGRSRRRWRRTGSRPAAPSPPASAARRTRPRPAAPSRRRPSRAARGPRPGPSAG